jgi:hypothetical protein
MKHYVIYDKNSGDIKGRFMLADDRLESEYLEMYSELGQSLLEITKEEYDARPETDKKIDLGAERLVNK